MKVNNKDLIHKHDFFQNVIIKLHKLIKDDNVIFTLDNLSAEHTDRGKIEVDRSKFNVLLGMWDEYDTKYHRDLIDKFDIIFNQYITKEEEELYDNLFSLPLGYNGNIIIKNEHIQDIKRVTDRSIDVFFAGHMSSQNRYNNMIKNIDFLTKSDSRKKYNFDFNITKGFMQGFKGPQYYDKLYNSKIAFCPPGNISTETYRWYESMMCGCVIVCPKMPRTKIYNDLPVIQVTNFETDAARVVLELLKDKTRLQELQQKNIEYWSKHYDQELVAAYIASKIKIK